MKFVLVLSISLISLIAAGQSAKSQADFVSGYFQDSSSENFERILAYYDSINENFVNPADCWRYCIDIYVDSNGVLFNGKQLENLDNLPNLLFEFLKNPKKFKFGSSTDQDFGTKGVIEIFFN